MHPICGYCNRLLDIVTYTDGRFARNVHHVTRRRRCLRWVWDDIRADVRSRVS